MKSVYFCLKTYPKHIQRDCRFLFYWFRMSVMFRFEGGEATTDNGTHTHKKQPNPKIVRMSAKMNDNKSNKSDFASVWIFTPFLVRYLILQNLHTYELQPLNVHCARAHIHIHTMWLKCAMLSYCLYIHILTRPYHSWYKIKPTHTNTQLFHTLDLYFDT